MRWHALAHVYQHVSQMPTRAPKIPATSTPQLLAVDLLASPWYGCRLGVAAEVALGPETEDAAGVGFPGVPGTSYVAGDPAGVY